MPMVLSVWSSLAHTLLASHAFNGSIRPLPHAQARSVSMILSVWYSLAHTLLASHAFNGSMRRLPYAQVALAPRPPHEARWARIVLSAECTAFGSPLARLSRFLGRFAPTASRFGEVPMTNRFGLAGLGPCSPLALYGWLFTGCLTLWSEDCR